MRRFSFKSMGTTIVVVVSILIMIAVSFSLVSLSRNSRETSRQVALDAIEKAVMQCYALEGAYPPDLDYLEDNYGLILNHNRYIYQYEVIAANIHPIIDIQFPGEVRP